jgi:hypothetical protein
MPSCRGALGICGAVESAMGTAADVRESERLAGARLLLIEDSPTLRKTLRLMLEVESAVVAEAGTGHEALDLLRAGGSGARVWQARRLGRAG